MRRLAPLAFVKHDCVQVCRHDDVGVDPEAFLVVAVCEAFGHDVEGCFRDKDGQPVDHGVGQVVDAGVVGDAVDFHCGSIWEGVAERGGGRDLSVARIGAVGRPYRNRRPASPVVAAHRGPLRRDRVGLGADHGTRPSPDAPSPRTAGHRHPRRRPDTQHPQLLEPARLPLGLRHLDMKLRNIFAPTTTP